LAPYDVSHSDSEALK